MGAGSGNRSEYEDDDGVGSWGVEYSITGPFTTVRSCGCTEIKPGQCLRCGSGKLIVEGVALCEGWLSRYEDEMGRKFRT